MNAGHSEGAMNQAVEMMGDVEIGEGMMVGGTLVTMADCAIEISDGYHFAELDPSEDPALFVALVDAFGHRDARGWCHDDRLFGRVRDFLRMCNED